MTGRLTELPCAASDGMLEHPRIYTDFEPRHLLRIGLRKRVFPSFFCQLPCYGVRGLARNS